jgi:hypothetical protein
MSQVFPGRFTAATDQPFVVFLIGMRVNNMLAFRKWIPVASAMGPMLQTLYTMPEKGFLGGETFFRLPPLMITLISYWKDYEHLEAFARSADDPHLPAWRAFNRAVGKDGSVGIWHETYLVDAGKHEALYGNMPRFGLATAFDHVPAIGRRETSRQRLGGESVPAVESP